MLPWMQRKTVLSDCWVPYVAVWKECMIVVIFVWRGWGPLAAVAMFVPLASCVGLLDWNPMVAMVCFGVSLVVGGLVCRYYGLKWNRGSGFHTMYWISLETWGRIYITVGGLFGALAAVALIKQAVAG